MKHVAQTDLVSGPVVVVRLDRLRLVSWAPPGAKPPQAIPGFRLTSDYRLQKPQGSIATYGRVRKFASLDSGTKIGWEYQRQRGWLKHWRITFIADDTTGLTGKTMRLFLKYCRYYRITLVELAFDFDYRSGVDHLLVRRSGSFGKSRRRRELEHPGELRYGARRSGKFVRCYSKTEVHAFRVELELHSSLLRKLRINTISDVSYVSSVHPKHFRLVRFEWHRLRRYLARRFPGKSRRILGVTRRKARSSLQRAMKYLRRSNVHNPHRFLTDLRINQTISETLINWAITFKEHLNGYIPRYTNER
jgi:hypothetical protein